MPKIKLGINVLEAAKKRIEWSFDNFEKLYISLSGGKDSTVMMHLVCKEAIKRRRKVGVFIVDLEGQYEMTINTIRELIKKYEFIIDVYWICLPISLRNAVSVYEPKWICWDDNKKEDWIREMPKEAISDVDYFPFFEKGMEFEEFMVLFGQWYANNKKCGAFVGIRTDESLNRYRTIASSTKTKLQGMQYTTQVIKNEHLYNLYPIYDWKTSDIWVYHSRYKDDNYNKLYDLMGKAGLSIHQMRLCQPYGDDQRRGLWLFHLIEPNTWAKVVARVNGANSGALYVMESGNINGYNKISKPNNHTWESFAKMFIKSLPPKTQEHFENKIVLFQKWWIERGYPEGIPDQGDLSLESKRLIPSWRRVCKSLLRNDYWCKGLGFSQHKSHAYKKYLLLMRRRKKQWNVNQLSILNNN
tara:strand:+ start:574 stop:1815 length:1242 start_codon:yes stop_codon:yes gene_type:complete